MSQLCDVGQIPGALVLALTGAAWKRSSSTAKVIDVPAIIPNRIPILALEVPSDLEQVLIANVQHLRFLSMRLRVQYATNGAATYGSGWAEATGENETVVRSGSSTPTDRERNSGSNQIREHHFNCLLSSDPGAAPGTSCRSHTVTAVEHLVKVITTLGARVESQRIPDALGRLAATI